MTKFLIALVLAAHGIGHSIGIIGVYRIATVNPSWRGDSWLLTGIAGQSATQLVGTALWTVSIVSFLALGGVVMGWFPATWWVPLAIFSSVVSLVGIVLFPIAFPVVSTLGAVAVDVVVLAAVMWLGWSPADLPA